MSQRSTTIKSQAGFTLVELAIVMIIIGLLIGGVLKGQELIGNAQVTATVAQVKGIEAATSTFKDTYAAIPGDILNPGARLPSCAGTCAVAAPNGNGRLETAPGAAPGPEAIGYFPQLSAAGLMTGIVPGGAATAFGTNFPAAKISGNGIIIGSIQTITAGLTDAIGTDGSSAGLYLAVVNQVLAGGNGNVGLKPTEALRIDTKLDDGVPGGGSVLGFGGANCGTANTAGGAPGTYATATNNATCGLYIRIQG